MAARKPSWPLPAIDFRLFAIEPQPTPISIIQEQPTAPKGLKGSQDSKFPSSDIGSILVRPLQSIIQQQPTSPKGWKDSKFPFSDIVGILQSILPRRQPPPPPIEAGCSIPRFRPYVAKVQWHGGARAFLSQLFPRYGHYCGPNWSSGKDGGSMLWDRRPIDWLDFCCYCHDIGYDTHDQAKLLKADLQFLECLERPRMATKGGAHVALVYRAMCIAGLRNMLIPYRMQLVRLQAKAPFSELLGKLARIQAKPPFSELYSNLIGLVEETIGNLRTI